MHEKIPRDNPKTLGKFVITPYYVDANLYHDIMVGISVICIRYLTNETHLDWFSEKQATVETSTYRLEYIAGKTLTEQIMNIRATLRYLGVPLRDTCSVFGDNESATNSASIYHVKSHNIHISLLFHRIMEAFPVGVMSYSYR